MRNCGLCARGSSPQCSPGLTTTASPTSARGHSPRTSSPAPSAPRVNGVGKPPPRAMRRSRWFSAAARSRTTASPGPPGGSGTSTGARRSSAPYSATRTAFTPCPPLLQAPTCHGQGSRAAPNRAPPAPALWGGGLKVVPGVEQAPPALGGAEDRLRQVPLQRLGGGVLLEDAPVYVPVVLVDGYVEQEELRALLVHAVALDQRAADLAEEDRRLRLEGDAQPLEADQPVALCCGQLAVVDQRRRLRERPRLLQRLGADARRDRAVLEQFGVRLGLAVVADLLLEQVLEDHVADLGIGAGGERRGDPARHLPHVDVHLRQQPLHLGAAQLAAVQPGEHGGLGQVAPGLAQPRFDGLLQRLRRG